MAKTRMQSKTHWTALAMVALAAVEAQGGALDLLFGDRAAAATLAIAAVVMAILREVTGTPIRGSAAHKSETRDRLHR